MKATKIIGVRLINYHNDGIKFKTHKDLILDFWILNKSQESGFAPGQLKFFYYYADLPDAAQAAYEKWFNSYDFQNTTDKEWLKYVDGTLNFFYHTEIEQQPLPDDTWFVYLLKSAEKATQICQDQIFHGEPNLQAFIKVEPNTKSEEVSGRRNGYVFSTELAEISPELTKGFYWGVAFQSPESVKVTYEDGDVKRTKVVSWAAECKHMTLLKVSGSGRFQVIQTFVEGKAWKEDRLIPQANVPKKAYSGHALVRYFEQNYFEMFGVWDEIDDTIKYEIETSNQRKNSLNTMNDEEVDVGKVIKDLDEFIEDGNVTREQRERNKEMRQAVKEQNKLREKAIRKKIREKSKDQRKKDRKGRNSLNPFLKMK